MSIRQEWEAIASGEKMPHLSESTRRRIRDALERAAARDRLENGGISTDLDDWFRVRRSDRRAIPFPSGFAEAARD